MIIFRCGQTTVAFGSEWLDMLPQYVTIDTCGMHEIRIFDEALKLQLGWNRCDGNR